MVWGRDFSQRMSADGICENVKRVEKCSAASWSSFSLCPCWTPRPRSEVSSWPGRLRCSCVFIKVCDRRTEASRSWFEIPMFWDASGALTASLLKLHDQFTSLYYSASPPYPQEIKSSNAVKQIHIQPRLLCSCFFLPRLVRKRICNHNARALAERKKTLTERNVVPR